MCPLWELAHLTQEQMRLALNIEEQTEIALRQVHKLQRVVVQQLVVQMLPQHLIQTHNVNHFHIYVLLMERAAFYQAPVKPDHPLSAVKAVQLVTQEPLV